MLDGASRLRDLVTAAHERRMPALALTDHGAMHGCVEFYKEAHKQGVKPILGCEVYVTAGSRLDRTPTSSGGAANHHLVLLARDEVGYRNLMKLTSRAFLEGFYYRPRIDHELLAQHSAGLLALTACLKGEVPSLLLDEKEERALETLGFYQRSCKDHVWLEVQDHDIADEQRVIPMLRRRAAVRRQLVATNDCHYITEDQAESQDLLICIGTGKELTIRSGFGWPVAAASKSADEMKRLFAEIPEAVTNTIEVAEHCNVELALGQSKMPVFPAGRRGERGRIPRIWLARRTGARYPEVTAALWNGWHNELSTIRQMGYSVLPHRPGLHRGGEGARDSGGTGARVGGGLARVKRPRHHERRPGALRPLPALPGPPSASPCPISTSTSASSGAARSSSTSCRSTARRASRRSSRSGEWRRAQHCATSDAC
jgi:DNA polymerase-3 subunit alpha